MEATKMTPVQVLRRVAVHAAMAGLICLGLKGLVVIDAKTFFGPTLYWACAFLVGGVSAFWMHLVNDARNLEAFMEIFEMDRDKYKIKRYQYTLFKLGHGWASGQGDSPSEFHLDAYDMIALQLKYLANIFGFVLVTVSLNVLPGLVIFSIILAAAIVTIRQADLRPSNRPSNVRRYLVRKSLDFFSYAGGMFAAAMILYTVTQAGSQ